MRLWLLALGVIVLTTSSPSAQQPGGKWAGGKQAPSSFDDSETVAFALQAESDFQGWLSNYRAVLVIQCREDKTNAYIRTGTAASVEPGDRHTVRIRLDDGKAFTQKWSESTNNEALFSPRAIPLIRQIAGAKEMLVGFTPFNANAAEIRFDVRGFDQHIGLVADTCNWSVDATPEFESLDNVDPNTLIGLNQVQLRTRFGDPYAESTNAEWSYRITDGRAPDQQIHLHFRETSEVVSFRERLVVERMRIGRDWFPGPPPPTIDSANPRTLLGLRMDEVRELVGQPLREEAGQWAYSGSQGQVTLIFAETTIAGAPATQVVSQVRTPRDVFEPEPPEPPSIDSIDDYRTLIGLTQVELQQDIGRPQTTDDQADSPVWTYQSDNGKVALYFEDGGSPGTQVVARVLGRDLALPEGVVTDPSGSMDGIDHRYLVGL